MSEYNGKSTERAFSPFKVFIADEGRDSRDCLREVLATYRHRIEIAGDAGDPDSTTELVHRLAPHIVFLDFGLLEKLKAGSGLNDKPFANTRAIIILSSPEKSQIISSFRLGAYGVILKGSPRRVCWNSIVAVTAGKYWLGDEPLAVLIRTLRDSGSATNGTALGRHFGLTQREIEIVQRIADGRSNKQVGQDFSIRERTVKHHLTNIFSKMGVSNRLELALLARDHQLSAASLPLDNPVKSGELDLNRIARNEQTGRPPIQAPGAQHFPKLPVEHLTVPEGDPLAKKS